MKSPVIVFVIISFVLSVINTSVDAKGQISSPLIPIVSIIPNYPERAAENKIEGYVKLEFTITKKGSVKDVIVVDSRPNELFNREATRALLRFKYIPKVVNGNVVSQRATQIIEFKLSNLKKNAKNRNANKSRLIITQANIKPKTKYKKLNYVDVAILDKGEEFNSEIISWQPLGNPIYYYKVKQALKENAQKQFDETHGLFKQFYKIYTSNTHPPILLTEYSSLNFTNSYPKLKFKSKLSLKSSGEVQSYKIIKFPKKMWYYKELFEKELKKLNFLPTKLKGKPVPSEIVLEGSIVVTTKMDVFKNWLISKYYLMVKPPKQWVRLVLLINKNGKVKGVKVVESSNKKFENEAIRAVKKYRFPRKKSDYQLIKVIDFKIPKDNS